METDLLVQNDPTYRDGYRSAENGVSIETNPYTHPRQKDLAEVWEWGWKAAFADKILRCAREADEDRGMSLAHEA